MENGKKSMMRTKKRSLESSRLGLPVWEPATPFVTGSLSPLASFVRHVVEYSPKVFLYERVA
jgi:hypothetical protein